MVKIIEDTVWDSAVARDFVRDLISEIEQVKEDCEVEKASEIPNEIADITITLINSYFQEI